VVGQYAVADAPAQQQEGAGGGNKAGSTADAGATAARRSNWVRRVEFGRDFNFIVHVARYVCMYNCNSSVDQAVVFVRV
jgi:hypothetical protein